MPLLLLVNSHKDTLEILNRNHYGPFLNIRTILSFMFRLLIQVGHTSVFEIVTSI